MGLASKFAKFKLIEKFCGVYEQSLNCLKCVWVRAFIGEFWETFSETNRTIVI